MQKTLCYVSKYLNDTNVTLKYYLGSLVASLAGILILLIYMDFVLSLVLVLAPWYLDLTKKTINYLLFGSYQAQIIEVTPHIEIKYRGRYQDQIIEVTPYIEFKYRGRYHTVKKITQSFLADIEFEYQLQEMENSWNKELDVYKKFCEKELHDFDMLLAVNKY